MAVEVWANDASATVTSGGTTAPAAGTVETWTLSGSTLPAISSSASPATQAYAADPAAESEKFLVTNVSGSTATVTRGADGTTPVTHAAGFTVVQVLTRASYQALQAVTVIQPSGDTTGAKDTAAINAVISAGGAAQLVQTGTGTPYYISSPLTPSTGAALRGAMPWSATSYDTYGAGTGAAGGTVIKGVAGFAGTAVITMTNATGTQYYGVTLENFTVDCSAVSSATAEGMHVEGAWGACFMSGVMIFNSGGHCLHFATNGTSGYNPDDWHVFRCKFSASYGTTSTTGCGVYADNLPDSWFTDCEASENQSDNWLLNYSLNTTLTRCKGENSAAGAGFHLGGQGGTGRAMNLTACTTHLNHGDGFLFDTDGSDGATGGVYQLANCTAINDNQAAGTTFAGFRSNGCPNQVTAVNCYAFGAAYGASQTGTNGGLTFTASALSGTSAALHDDGSGTNRLASRLPVGGSSRANVVAYGADRTGTADSTTAIQAAASAVIAAGGGTVYLPAGNYKVSSTVTANVTGVAVYIVGDGRWATNILYSGSGDCLRIYDTTSVRTVNGGGVLGLTIDGTNSSTSAASAGLHMGDMFQYRLDLAAQNFSNHSGSIGVHLDNQFSWTEQLTGSLYITACTTALIFDHASGAGSSSTGSFDRLRLDVDIDQSDNSAWDGVVWQNGANMQDGHLAIRGNVGAASGTVTSALLRITGSSPAGTGDTGTFSSILYSQIFVGVECDGAEGDNGPICVAFGSSDNFVSNCTGQLNFFPAAANFQASTGGGGFDFAGDINGGGNLVSQYVMNNVLTSFVNIFGDGDGGPAVLTGDANNLLQYVTSAGLTGYVGQSQAAATSAVTVTAATITSLGSLSIPANDPVAGARYKVTAHGTLGTNSSAAPTYICDLRWGGTSGTQIIQLRSASTANSPVLTTGLSAVPVLIEGEVEFITASTCVAWLRLTWRPSTTASPTVGLNSITSAVTVTVSSAESLSLNWTWSTAATSTTITIASSSFERVA